MGIVRTVRPFRFAALAIVVLAGVALARGGGRPSPAATPAPASRGLVYTVDNAHSFIEFSVRLLGFNRVRGTFPDYVAHVYYDPDSVQHSSVSVRIAVKGVSTHEEERDHDLESANFFDAAKYPFIRFDSREVVADPAGFVARGDLTIRDV